MTKPLRQFRHPTILIQLQEPGRFNESRLEIRPTDSYRSAYFAIRNILAENDYEIGRNYTFEHLEAWTLEAINRCSRYGVSIWLLIPQKRYRQRQIDSLGLKLLVDSDKELL